MIYGKPSLRLAEFLQLTDRDWAEYLRRQEEERKAREAEERRMDQ